VEAQAVPGPGGLGVFAVAVLGLALVRKKGRVFFF
jgi:hypothetical protein